MQGGLLIRKWQWRAAGTVIAVAAFIWARQWIILAAEQLLLGGLAALAVLPVMKRLERRLPKGLSAALALFLPGAALIAALLLVLPPLIRQGREWFSMLPSLLADAGRFAQRGAAWMDANGLPVSGMLTGRMQQMANGAADAVVGWMGEMAGGAGKWMFTPLFAYYFLRDRQQIAAWLMTRLPEKWRTTTAGMLREMKREVAGYLRGQLLISAAVGVLTAFGLLLCGIRSWLFLGLLIGFLELIPYAGPVIGGALAALFALPMGWGRALWAVGAVVAVQQLDGSFLSPKLLSKTTRLHPAAVILLITVGGAAAGVRGILLSVPLVLCIRAAVHTLRENREL